MGLSDASQKKAILQVRKHIGGTAGTIIDNNLSAHTDKASCAPAMVTVPTNAAVKGFRLLAGEESNGEGAVSQQE